MNKLQNLLTNTKVLTDFDSGMILIDLQKTFDTTDHYIFLQKLLLLGFSNEVINSFRSYLRSRKFHVNVHLYVHNINIKI